MNLKPLRDLVVVKRDAEVKQTASGIFIQTGTVDVPDKGTVVAVGPGKVVKDEFQPNSIKVGDYLLFGKNAGTKIVHEGEELFILRNEEIYAVLT